MLDLQTLLEGQQFNSIDEVNAKLVELTQGNRLGERSAAWNRDNPKRRAQELAYDALEIDPDCIDAQRLLVSLAPTSLANLCNEE
jgi:hypothetical protein